MMLVIGRFRSFLRLAWVVRYSEWVDKIHQRQKSYDLMKHFEILASLYFRYGLLQQAEGLAVAVCFLVAAGIFLWRMWRYLKKDNDEELEREHHGDNIP